MDHKHVKKKYATRRHVHPARKKRKKDLEESLVTEAPPIFDEAPAAMIPYKLMGNPQPTWDDFEDDRGYVLQSWNQRNTVGGITKVPPWPEKRAEVKEPSVYMDGKWNPLGSVDITQYDGWKKGPLKKPGDDYVNEKIKRKRKKQRQKKAKRIKKNVSSYYKKPFWQE